MTQDEFLKTYAPGLNEQQRMAATAGQGQTLLLAVPGSGKTTVLVTRLGYLIHCLGADPDRILTMTYTVAATREMDSRFRRQFGTTIGRPEIRTINGLSQKIISYCSEGSGRQAFELEDNEGQLAGLIRNLYRKYYRDYPLDSTIRDIRTAITYFKNSLLPRSELDALGTGLKHFPDIFDEYNRILRGNRKMDYDDQLIYARTILETMPHVRNAFRDRFQWICVDEAQDTSRLQHEIIHAIAGDKGNLFMVGDEDQSIYGFRAACPEALLKFREVYPAGQVLLLEENYRSTGNIVTSCSRFVSRNHARTPKEMHPNRDAGDPIEYIRVLNRSAQYRYLLSLVRTDPEPVTILFRNNDSAVPLIDLFERSGINFRCRRFDDVFFSHRILSDITDILLFSENEQDPERFMRIYYKLGCMVSRSAAEYACAQSLSTGKPILYELMRCNELSQGTCAAVSRLYEQMQQLRNDAARQALNRIRYQMGYGGYVEQNQLDTGKFVILDILAEKLPSASALLERLSELRELIREHTDTDARIVLSTIHSAKGLEYDRVWLLDAFDGILPANTREQSHTAEELRDYEEDRRLFYVGMTRAKTRLSVFTCRQQSGEFTQELLQDSPRERFERNNILSFLGTDFCGTEYQHRKYGTGIIEAQTEENVLVSFGTDNCVLMGIGEMISQRTRILSPNVSPKEAASSAHTEFGIGIGSRVFHTTFGEGIVTEFLPDKLSVCFDRDRNTRTFLRSSLSEGKIRKV